MEESDVARARRLAASKQMILLDRTGVRAVLGHCAPPAAAPACQGRRAEGCAPLLVPAGERWAGVDEVGRGPLAGPVVACACLLPPGWCPEGLRDSKALSPRARRELARVILERADDVRVAVASHFLVDRLNVLRASLAAMGAAADALEGDVGRVVVDGALPLPLTRQWPQQAMPRADARVACVAAASVVAKVLRDTLMEALAPAYPGYGWERNKGYGTPQHLEALAALGPSPLHRRSFRPVWEAGSKPA
ncbi:ribonuclease HII [Carboxydochorda subterranea]|uniref:Ribonuclease HII n=1 Tax=Carboxydichorda subterranea TaxID=3109565 RepID=A0ABZ1C029_9FIRM|nr:ribonuclease HII [Limnochorda sp. L945t]WRP18432.1 ribonuclease HII [Limnochorda sp. L945t]